MSTKTLEEIEQAVSELSPEDFAAFRDWFAKFDNQQTHPPTNNPSATSASKSAANQQPIPHSPFPIPQKK